MSNKCKELSEQGDSSRGYNGRSWGLSMPLYIDHISYEMKKNKLP